MFSPAPLCAALALALCACCVRAAGEGVDVLKPEDRIEFVTSQPNTTDLAAIKFRTRVTALTPTEPVALRWRYGGEGQGGQVFRGTLAEALEPGAWSPAVPVTTFVKGRDQRFLTLTLDRAADRPVGQTARDELAPAEKKPARAGRGPAEWKNVELEFEFSYQGKVIKTFKESGPDGGTVGIVIPLHRLTGLTQPTSPEFLNDLGGLLSHATRRAEKLDSLPWAKGPLPQRLLTITDLGGYGAGVGYGIRHTNRAIVELECRAVRQLGINGLRGMPAFLREMINQHEGFAKDFIRGCEEHGTGYPVPEFRSGQKTAPPGAGCPYGPGIAEAQAKGIADVKQRLFARPLDEIWALTVDEIGPIVNGAPEGKRHLAVCPRCAEGFRGYLKSLTFTPQTFGRPDWAGIRPVDLWPEAAKPGAAEEKPAWARESSGRLLAYYTRKFLNYSSAQLFTAQRDAFAAANEEKRRALAASDKESPAAKRPFVYSFALRGNTFLMGGASLDFFDFYRHADNALVYETSNRDPRVWHWDSYLCDVGRAVAARQKIEFGIYVKPHRGAPIQRALSALSRNARFLFWYTYGPDYSKGDSFSQVWSALEQTSKAAHLIGKAESVLFGAESPVPAEIAVVRTDPALGVAEPPGSAQWEEGKWTYTALAHAHLPVEPLDEALLLTEDLSRYKAIYITGHTLPQKTAEKIAAWVAAGGTLYTSAGGLAYNEAGDPLGPLQPVLGLKTRAAPEVWYRVAAYGATSLQGFDDPKAVVGPVPEGARVKGEGPFEGSFMPVVGREVLQPAAGADVLARFSDGGVAATRHKHGQGEAYVVGFYPGLEYSAAVRTERFDLARDFPPLLRAWVAAPALARVKPVVDAGLPTVEGILLRNPASGKRAVSLVNWTWRVARAVKTVTPGQKETLSYARDFAPADNLHVRIRGAGDVAKAASVALERELSVTRDGGDVLIALPKLEEGDVLLLE